MSVQLSPKQIVNELDKFIIGQDEAKKAGYVEPTYTTVDGYKINGKSIDIYRMEFAAVRI